MAVEHETGELEVALRGCRSPSTLWQQVAEMWPYGCWNRSYRTAVSIEIAYRLGGFPAAGNCAGGMLEGVAPVVAWVVVPGLIRGIRKLPSEEGDGRALQIKRCQVRRTGADEDHGLAGGRQFSVGGIDFFRRFQLDHSGELLHRRYELGQQEIIAVLGLGQGRLKVLAVYFLVAENDHYILSLVLLGHTRFRLFDGRRRALFRAYTTIIPAALQPAKQG